MKKIKYLLVGLCMLLLTSCSSSVDLLTEREVLKKTSYETFTNYYIGENWKEWCNTIKADDEFAEVGDKIVCIDGKIVVIKKE